MLVKGWFRGVLFFLITPASLEDTGYREVDTGLSCELARCGWQFMQSYTYPWD